MRKRIYYLIPELLSAQRIMNDLLLANIEEKHIHFLAKDGLDLSTLHRANLLQESDIVHGAELGAVVGGATGLFAGLVGAFVVLSDTGLPWGSVVLATGVAGVLFGAWSSSMIGSSAPNTRLKPFRRAIERSQILLMVDVPRWRVVEIEKLLQRTHPEAVLGGVEPSILAWP
ncbi:DUF1269 domain-containing protein [Crenobacter sp. SG2305]|uniref:DUF1269 domain-containing protein n=1 Tax=Crenobacter oryzisoli TaxID=3056844 RepID=UPI0025AA6CB1|nr:DUF1269 domain-containing protein [Crenobacter sp. SG2305]MDN0082819.1 DUF1269 domain-containing protein [Crenobacter sp. SG2305]